MSSFLHARSTASRNDESDKKLPSALYPYRGAFGSLSEATVRCVGPQRPPLVEQISILSIQSALQDETPREQFKLSKEMEDGLRHINLLGEIKKRREVARMKYQEILLKRSSSSVCSTDSHVSSGDSTLSSRSVAKIRRRRRRRLRRQVSEIDDRDDMQLLEAEMFSFAVSSTSTSPASTSPTKKVPLAYGSSLSLETMETTISDESGTSKKKPHIKKYAKEYNMLVTAVSIFFTKNKHSGPERDSNYKGSLLKYGTLRKISHIDVGIGIDLFCELRPGMMTFYNNFDGDDTSVDVKSMHIRKGECTFRPTKELTKAPFPMWDAVFEVSINDKPPQFFMAESSTDRQSWLTAFDAAISLQQDPSSDTLEDREEGSTARLAYDGEENIIGHNADILLYLHVRGLLQAASSREEYMESISILRGKTISVPVHWLKEYFEDSPSLSSGNNDIPVEWARLEQELFSINGHIVRGGMDSVVGSLKSHILDLDICSCAQNQIDQPKIKESQAIFFARDILLSFDREQSENQAIYCTSKMLGNDLLVSIARGSDGMEPVKVQLQNIHGQCRSKQTHISGKDGLEERENSCEYTVEVTLRAPSIYRICSSDPLDNEETWSLMRTNYVQKFALSPDSLRRMDQFVQFDIVPYQ